MRTFHSRETADAIVSTRFHTVTGTPDAQPTGRGRKMLKRLGWIGFLAFLLKGLAWLIAGYLILK